MSPEKLENASNFESLGLNLVFIKKRITLLRCLEWLKGMFSSNPNATCAKRWALCKHRSANMTMSMKVMAGPYETGPCSFCTFQCCISMCYKIIGLHPKWQTYVDYFVTINCHYNFVVTGLFTAMRKILIMKTLKQH